MFLLSKKETHILLEKGAGYLSDYKIPFDQVAESMKNPKLQNADFKNFSKFIMRALFKDSYEVLQEYCLITKQNSIRIKQPWHQFSRLIRNCLAHNYIFTFNKHSKKFLPITWNNLTISHEMEGKELSTNFMGPGKMLDLVQEFHDFAENILE